MTRCGMEIITTVTSLRNRLRQQPSIAFVPTMGSLHDGHLALIHAAQQKSDFVVASIFVNRLQFLPTEDFDTYPRTLEEDCDLLQSHNVDIVFAPGEKDLYPVPQEFLVEPPGIANILEGEFRPGFFRGVTTVVLKLFNIVAPQATVFGKKDYQQLHILREMARQLNLPIEILAVDTVRAPDGLALSSRNRYLASEERREAPRLYQTLLQLAQKIRDGNTDFSGLEKNAIAILNSYGWKVDYVAVRQQQTFASARAGGEHMVVLGAARLGRTRLIDSVEVQP
jgi:pantoate--beta-alanine ligase